MRQTNARTLAEQKPLGVIDVITAGFEIVRKRPWTILVPMIFDVLIWILPKLSLAGLFRPSLNELFSTRGLTPEAAASVEQARQGAVQFVNSLNLLGLVSAALNSTARLPALLKVDPLAAEVADLHSPITSLAYTLSLNSGVLAFVLFVPLFLLGLLIVAVYAEMIAQGVRPLENPVPLSWVPRVGAFWLKLIIFSILLGLITLGGGLVLVLAQAVTPIGGDAVSFIGGLVAVGLFWISIYLFFAVSAMVINNVGVLEAIRRSILLFRAHFWASLGLILLTALLEHGLALIWRGLAVTPLGVVLAIAANAFVGTALLAATMVFYQDRMNWMEKMRARRKVGTR